MTIHSSLSRTVGVGYGRVWERRRGHLDCSFGFGRICLLCSMISSELRSLVPIPATRVFVLCVNSFLGHGDMRSRCLLVALGDIVASDEDQCWSDVLRWPKHVTLAARRLAQTLSQRREWVGVEMWYFSVAPNFKVRHLGSAKDLTM